KPISRVIQTFAEIAAVSYPARRNTSGTQRSEIRSIAGRSEVRRRSELLTARPVTPCASGKSPERIDPWEGTVHGAFARAPRISVPTRASSSNAGVRALPPYGPK
ncbi:MAG: hypothetical protein M3O84_03920, partial [Actinomycetota bacterium]|nr:hypothetical protein [Actinomycetota bacterium]